MFGMLSKAVMKTHHEFLFTCFTLIRCSLSKLVRTEFLYQQQRFRPTENQMILWPAAYTHAHRGNTVFGDQSKYVVTGWFYYD